MYCFWKPVATRKNRRFRRQLSIVSENQWNVRDYRTTSYAHKATAAPARQCVFPHRPHHSTRVEIARSHVTCTRTGLATSENTRRVARQATARPRSPGCRAPSTGRASAASTQQRGAGEGRQRPAAAQCAGARGRTTEAQRAADRRPADATPAISPGGSAPARRDVRLPVAGRSPPTVLSGRAPGHWSP